MEHLGKGYKLFNRHLEDKHLFAALPLRIQRIYLPRVPEDVRLWQIEIDVANEVASEVACHLTKIEVQKASRYRHTADRVRFIVARVVLKHILAREAADVEPRHVELSHELYGKPVWPRIDANFNVAHSGCYALVAISNRRLVGVDIEEHLGESLFEELASLVVTSSERAELDVLDDHKREVVFMDHWVCKEAALKATGHGIANALQIFSVLRAPEHDVLLRIEPGFASDLTLALASLSVRTLEVKPRYSAALAFGVPLYPSTTSGVP